MEVDLFSSSVRRLTREDALFFLALGLGLFVRFLDLGKAPLSDLEAGWALQALQVGRGSFNGQFLAIGPQPAYVLLTGVLFYLSDATNFLARFWPAAAGASLVLLPYFFRRRLGRIAALILTFGLALDPGLVTISRLTGGPVLGLGFALWALTGWYFHKPIVAGLFGGLALLSDPSLLNGLLGVGLAAAVTLIIWGKPLQSASPFISAEPADYQPPVSSESRQTFWKSIAWLAVITLFLVGTLFIRIPQGLAGWLEIFPRYLSGWVQSSGVSVSRLLAVLFFYQPLALLFGLITIGRLFIRPVNTDAEGLTDERLNFEKHWIVFWFVFSLLLWVIYPARQVSDLVWVLVPLWILAAVELSRYLPIQEGLWVSLAQGSVLLVLLALFWLTLAGLAQAPLTSPGLGLRYSILGGILVLGILTTGLVSLGWSWDVARRGVVWGVSVGLVLYALSGMWSAAQVSPNQPQELWAPGPGTGQVKLMLQTLGDLSEWNTGFRQSIDVTAPQDIPSLQWVLRDYAGTRYVDSPSSRDQPSVVFTRESDQSPELAAAYRGQDFVWWVNPDWEGALPLEWERWITYRQAPVQNVHLILWARTNLFPGAAAAPNTSAGQP
jgi:hypothetical protein